MAENTSCPQGLVDTVGRWRKGCFFYLQKERRSAHHYQVGLSRAETKLPKDFRKESCI